MEYLIKNPGGRVVSVSDEQTKKMWLEKHGFSDVTKDEAEKYYLEREARFALKEEAIDYSDGVYFSTVTQGGTDGYGVASANIYKDLTELGAKPSFNYVDQKVGLLFHAPYNITRLETPIKIIYTMFESDKIPEEWEDYLCIADKILVPSKWCQKVFDKAGFNADVVPLGYDDTIYKPIQRQVKNKHRAVFNFLHFNAFNVRKGFMEVFKAFVEEFQPDEPCKLILKTTLDKPPIPLGEYPNVEVITGKVDQNKMMKIMARSDAFVFPSRGEGFGMTPLEAMATGLPTIVPNAHGISEYFNSEYMYETTVAETCPGLYHRYKGQDVGNMVICDVKQLRRQMRYLYEHQEQALVIGKKSSEYVKNYTLRKTAEHLNRIIQEAKEWKPKAINIGGALPVKTI